MGVLQYRAERAYKFGFLGLGLGATFILAAFIRFWAAPLSAGADTAQFWAFAKVFQLYGLDFYRYADGTLSIFPFGGWGFVYPPVWLLSLRLSLLAAPSSWATGVMVDTSWRLAVKAPIIAADLTIGSLIFWAVPGSKFRKLLFASLWLFHPAVWYESAVFGQFEAIAAAFLLASVIAFERRRDKLAFLLAGLALMTKQHTFIPIVLMLAVSARYINKRRFVSNCFILFATVVLLSIPFLLTGNLYSYAHSLFLPGQAPAYQYPLVYAFSGSGALLTYLHSIFGWETSGFLQLNIPILVVATLVAIVLSYVRSITPTAGALAGFLLFIGLFYRINYQYLVVYIPLAILVAAKARYRCERAITFTLVLLPALWLWLSDTSFWFNYFQPINPWVTPLLARIGLVSDAPDYIYVAVALVFMSLSLAYVAFTFLRRGSGYDIEGGGKIKGAFSGEYSGEGAKGKRLKDCKWCNTKSQSLG